jgi:predicted RNA polymerase sigma factor
MKTIDWNTVRAAVDVLAQRAPSPALAFANAFAGSPSPSPKVAPPVAQVIAPSLPEQPLDEFREFKWD